MPDVDDGSIPDDARLLRRVAPVHVIDDKNTGQLRPSSAAFKDPNLSVDAEPILHANNLDWHFSLAKYPSHSLVAFLAGVARGAGLAVVHKPIAGENEAHTEVIGKKTAGGIANRLRDASTWVHIGDHA